MNSITDTEQSTTWVVLTSDSLVQRLNCRQQHASHFAVSGSTLFPTEQYRSTLSRAKGGGSKSAHVTDTCGRNCAEHGPSTTVLEFRLKENVLCARHSTPPELNTTDCRVFSVMFDDVISTGLQAVLAEVFESVDKKQLNVSLVGDIFKESHLELTDLRLKKTLLKDLNLPVEVKEGLVGKLVIQGLSGEHTRSLGGPCFLPRCCLESHGLVTPYLSRMCALTLLFELLAVSGGCSRMVNSIRCRGGDS